MTLKNFSKYLGGLILAGVLLWWVLRGTDPRELWEQVRRVSWPLLLLSVTLNLGHNVFRVWRWQALLAPVKTGIPFRPMFAAVMVGYMTSWVIPGRLGELVRPLLLTGRESVPLGPCLGSVVADRLLDGSAVVVLFAVSTFVTPLEGAALEYAAPIRAASTVAALAVVIFLGVMLAISSRSEAISDWLSRRSGVVRWLGTTAVSISGGVSALRSLPLLIRIVGHTMAAWLTITLSIWIGCRAAGAEIPIGAVMFIMPLLVLGVAIPTPGGAGSYHGLMKVGLMMFGVGEVAAISAGLLVHAGITIPVILLGLILLWTEGISWRHLVGAARQFRSLGDAMDPTPVERVVEGTS